MLFWFRPVIVEDNDDDLDDPDPVFLSSTPPSSLSQTGYLPTYKIIFHLLYRVGNLECGTFMES